LTPSAVSEGLERRLAAMLAASPTIMRVLEAARAAVLPDWRLFSGAVYQTAWNALTGRDPDYGIADYDLAYFDAADLSAAAEAARAASVHAHLPLALADKVEVVNQARVHLWFETEFGRAYPPLANTDESLDRALSRAHAVGVRLEADGALSIAAPFGLDDIFALELRPADHAQAALHRRKAQTAAARWPEVAVYP
jgi:hypothetical protein